MDCMINFSTFYTSVGCFSNMLVERFGWDKVEAGSIVMIPYLMFLLLMPLIVKYIDITGNRINLNYFSGICSMLAFLVAALLPDGNKSWYSLIPIVLLGFYGTIQGTVILPLVPLLIEHKYLGTAFGLLSIF